MNHGYASMTQGGNCEPFHWEVQPLAAQEVRIHITHCGICHSDIHLIDNDWAISQYPLVPGHEAVGVIEEVGSQVDSERLGQRVGVGWQSQSCGNCLQCRRGNEHFCPNSQATCVHRHGGFSRDLVVHQRFAIEIPDEIASAEAGPLFCGGITVYTPFKTHNIQANQKVGIMGLGGLGHLALQFANAFGCESYAFSTSAGKREEALRYGAVDLVGYGSDAFQKLFGQFDFLISTVSADLDWGQILKLLAPEGTLILVGASPKPLNIQASMLINGARRIAGSVIGNPLDIREMLDFCARTGVRPQIELLPFNQVNQALDRVRKNQARYRMVLGWDVT